MSSVFEIVTEQIIAALREGVVPWRKPWRTANGANRSLISRKAYRGINIWLLTVSATRHGFTSPWWVTDRQAREKGGSIVSRIPTIVVVYVPAKKPETATKPKQVLTSEAQHTRKGPLFPRYFRVYNLEQTEGLEHLVPQSSGVPSTAPLPATAAEQEARYRQIIADLPDPRPEIINRGSKAYYDPMTDRVVVPPLDRFETWADYAATMFHELAHSTGHGTRLARPGITDPTYFGSHKYSQEEIVAEMCANFLSYETGIFDQVSQSSAAYLDGWHRNLGDKRLDTIAPEEEAAGWIALLEENCQLFFKASREAERAAEYLLGHPLVAQQAEESSACDGESLADNLEVPEMPPMLPLPVEPPPFRLWDF